MDEATSRQLQFVGEVAEALAAADVRWWLFGGWAMDAHAGRVTRDHADIEFFIRLEDANLVREALTAIGFAAPSGLYPEECQPFLKAGVELGAWYLKRREDGSRGLYGRWTDFPLAAGSFDGPPLTLEGDEVPALSIAGLLDMKTRFPGHKHGGPLRQKDIDDIAFLRTLVS